MIELNGAVKYYRNTVGLNGVDLSFKRGEVVGLLGENGAGKTTLLKAVMGLLRLNSGSVSLDGQGIRNAAFEKLSYITEEGSTFPGLSVTEHAEFYEVMLPRFDRARFDRFVNFFELPVDKKARTLSRGMRQKLEITVGMSRGADFVLMDEPFLGEYVFTRRDFIKFMIADLTPNRCFVIATHQLQEIEPILSRTVVLKAGKVIADENVENLRAEGRTLLSLIRECYEYDDRRVLEFMEQ